MCLWPILRLNRLVRNSFGHPIDVRKSRCPVVLGPFQLQPVRIGIGRRLNQPLRSPYLPLPNNRPFRAPEVLASLSGRPFQPAKPTGHDVTSGRPAPEAWRHSLLLADGDHSRMTVHADGTVSVANKPVRGGSAVG